MLNAVIDIGSTSVRLMITDGERVHKIVNTTRLAENMGEGNYLQPLNIERSAQAVAEFYFEAVQAGAENVYAFATEAVRSARNRHAFTERVHELCGLDVEVLSKQKEAEMGFVGAYRGGVCCVIDMGGASTELTVGDGEKILYTKSLPYGIVRLSAVEKAKTALEPFIAEQLKYYGEIPAFDSVIAIGGTITTMAAIKNQLAVYNPNAVNGFVMTAEDIRNMYDKIKVMPLLQRKQLPGLPEKRADIIAPGILMYAMLLDYLGATELTVSEGDNTEGYLITKGLLTAGFKAEYKNIL